MSEHPTPRLLANVAAEEGTDWRDALADPRVRTVARLWRLIFPDAARLVGPDEAELRGDADTHWPAGFGARAPGAAFDWLDAPDACVAWLTEPGLPVGFSGPAQDAATAQVHDKGFAQDFAEASGYLPKSLRGCIRSYSADQLHAPEAVANIQAELDAWPAWMSQAFTLKPRRGSSGRGRVPGRAARADTPQIRGGLARLAERGGAILEPWLERTSDLSAQIRIPQASSDPLRLLGTLQQLCSPSGVFRGNFGQLDSRGRVFSGHPCEEELREAAAALAGAARGAGFSGPCGVDAFVFRVPAHDGREARVELRPLVELNARFTTGLIAIGLVRRALARVKSDLGLAPGMRFGFLWALDPPTGTSWERLGSSLGRDALLIPLAGQEQPVQPALLFSRDPEAVGELAADFRRSRGSAREAPSPA